MKKIRLYISTIMCTHNGVDIRMYIRTYVLRKDMTTYIRSTYVHMYVSGYLGLPLSVVPYGSRFWVRTAVPNYGGPEHLGQALRGHHVALAVACYSEVEQVTEGIYLTYKL